MNTRLARFKRSAIGLSFISLGLCVTFALARTAATKAPPVRSFEIRYRIVTSTDTGPGEIVLRYLAPDNWRIDTRAAKRRETVVAAGDTILIHDLNKNAFLLMARDQAATLQTRQLLDIDLSKRYADPKSYLAYQKREMEKCAKYLTTAKLLGRECYVYGTSANDLLSEGLPPDVPAPLRDFTMQSWVDKQLFVPLHMEAKIGQQPVSEIDAISVRVNGPVARNLFATHIPPGSRVFKGALSDIPDLSLFQEVGPEDLSEVISPPGLGDAAPFYAPAYLPSGFQQTGTSTDLEGRWFSAQFAAKSGSTLLLEESRDTQNKPLSPFPGAHSQMVGQWPGKMREWREPFHRVGLTWQREGWRFRIDAAEVPAAEVVRIGKSMSLQRPKPKAQFEEPEVQLKDPVAIQAQVHFLVLVLQPVPQGFHLMHSAVQPFKQETANTSMPEQLSLSYAAGNARWFSISEMRGEEGVELEGWSRVTIGGHPGWYRQEPHMGHELEWVQEGTEITLNGNLSKEELLKIAASFVPADPSARQQVLEYQRKHPEDAFLMP